MISTIKHPNYPPIIIPPPPPQKKHCYHVIQSNRSTGCWGLLMAHLTIKSQYTA